MSEQDQDYALTLKTYLILGEIKGQLNGIVQMQAKTIYAVIALAGATVSLKLVATPPLAVITRFINLFVFLFALVLAVNKRRVLHGWQYVLLFGLFGIAGNLYYLIFLDAEWLRTTMFIAANSNMALFLWNWDRWEKSEKIRIPRAEDQH